MVGELGLGFILFCFNIFVFFIYVLVFLGKEVGEKFRGLFSLGVSGCFKVEVDKLI